MNKSIIEILDNTALKYSEKNIICSSNEEITYKDFVNKSKIVGTFLAKKNYSKNNVIIFIDKTINCFLGMFGASYANCCYTIVDINSPEHRIETIIDILKPKCIITDEKKL